MLEANHLSCQQKSVMRNKGTTYLEYFEFAKLRALCAYVHLKKPCACE